VPEWSEHLRSRLTALHMDAAREAEVVLELSQHLDERYEELLAGGASDAEAVHRALDELGDSDALAVQMRVLRQAGASPQLRHEGGDRFHLTDLWQDLRYAARMLRRQPDFAATAVLTLALGIGANTAIFSLVNATLLQQLPVAERDRLVYVHKGDVGGVFSYPLYETLRDHSEVHDGLAAWGGISASLNVDDTTALVEGVIVTGNFFELLGIAAVRGRLISPADDAVPRRHPVAVISHRLWQAHFGGHPEIVGREVRLNGHVFTIVGVAPRAFVGPRLDWPSDLYVPMMMQPIMRPPRGGYSGEQDPDLLADRRSWLFGVARLKPSITLDRAREALAALATTHDRANGRSVQSVRMALVPIDEGDPRVRERLQAAALLLGGVVAAVLLIACANIANLLLAQAASRQREIAIRLAIGASRARLVRQLLTESVLMAAIGGVMGLGLAWSAVRIFRAALPPPARAPLANDTVIDGNVLLFTAGLSVLTGLVFGLAPALRASRPGLVPALRSLPIGSQKRRGRLSLQRTLVVAEVALAMLLLIPAGLFVRSLQTARAIDPGIDVDRLISAPLNIHLLRYTKLQGREFYRRIVEQVEQLPGVEAASLARVPVLAGQGRMVGFMVEGRPTPDDLVSAEGGGVRASDRNHINVNVVGPRFFRTLGIPFITGRDFTEQDVEDGPPVVIINQAAATMHFGGENPLGTRVGSDPEGPSYEIVGVVRDSKYAALGEPAPPVAYLPLAQHHETGMTLYVRGSVRPALLIAAIRREIRALDPDLPVPDVRPMAETIGASLIAARTGAWLLSLFGGLALLLAAIGIYGVLSYSIARRTGEMGVRLALGAEPRSVFLLVVRDGMWLVGVGIVVGLAGGLAGARALAGFLYSVPASDLVTFGGMAIVLATAALLACAIPARRAMRVDPITALRSE